MVRLMMAFISQTVPRHPLLSSLNARLTSATLRWVRHASSNDRPRRFVGRVVRLVVAVGISATGSFAYYIYTSSEHKTLTGPPKADIKFEKERQKSSLKEEIRDLVSFQHLQIKKSWENPGVYAWGSNAGKVVAPDSNEKVIKKPRRISYFEGQILRDMKLNCYFGAALTENGDLVQWGTAFCETDSSPTVTLRGKDLVKLAISRDRIIALASNGSVYAVPVSNADQVTKKGGSFRIPFWSGSSSSLSYRKLDPKGLVWGEKVVEVKSGLDHGLLMTSTGRVFSFASSTQEFPTKGQLGVPGLTWMTRPKGAFDQAHEICTRRGSKGAKIAAGDYHSLVLDTEGRVFSFGDNTFGQLGFGTELDMPYNDVPSILPVNKLYDGTGFLPKVTSIAAGGSSSFFTVDATKIRATEGDEVALGTVVADVWACGQGIYGNLGNGRWTHVSTTPTKIKALSNLFEWDEKKRKSVPIRLARISVGTTHASAIMDNMTNVSASDKTSEHDTNWGADILWWGGNEHYQLGTGKRANSNSPIYIGPLDGGKSNQQYGGKGESYRFQITPRRTICLDEDGKSRKLSVEQRAECGRYVTAVYSGT